MTERFATRIVKIAQHIVSRAARAARREHGNFHFPLVRPAIQRAGLNQPPP